MRQVDQKLKKLYQKWNKLLKKSGFEDIEDAYGNLKSYSYLGLEADEVRSREAYYEAARALLHTDYIKGQDKAVWTYHAEGYTQPEIAKMMGLSQSAVHRIIEDIETRLIHGK